jgi:hypothetical protein
MQLEISDHPQFFFDCSICWDTGLIVEKKYGGNCLACHAREAPLTDARRLLMKALRRRLHANQAIEERPYRLACLLTHFTTTRPISRPPIQEWLGVAEREFKKQIEHLRRDWLLPIGSRKGRPNGYWIITNEADFLSWHEHFRRQALTEFSTAAELMRQNFPGLAASEASAANLHLAGG